MQGLMKDVLISLGMGMVLPGILLNMAVMLMEEQATVPVSAGEVIAEEIVESHPVSMTMRLRNPDGNTSEMDMDTYLVGVILGEMPVWFEEEALKAQAVVARTYTCKAYTTGGKHGDGSVCTTSSCCQAYIPEETYLAQGGTEEAVNKVRAAVLETTGNVLMYENQLIEATYFSCSGGRTEDAVAVWGMDYPYLRAVDSPGEEEAAYYTNTGIYTRQELETALNVSLPGECNSWFSDITYTDGYGIDTVTIAGETFTGVQIRKLLNLPSTSISLIPNEKDLTIISRGFGHRVGMSQYGADAMAISGSTYADILAHYYPGTCLERRMN